MNSKSVAKLIKVVKNIGRNTAIATGGGKKQVMTRLKPKLEKGQQTYKNLVLESDKAVNRTIDARRLRGKRKAGEKLVNELEEQANKASTRAKRYASQYKQRALRNAQDEVAKRGARRLKYAGLGLMGLAGAGLLGPKEKNIL